MHNYNEFEIYDIIIPLDKKPNANNNIHVVCPKCKDTREHREKSKDPVLGVNIEKGCWRCNNCGWTGSLKKHKELNEKFVSVIKNVNKSIDYDINNPIVKWFWDKRRLSINTLKKNKISFSNMMLLIKNSTDKELIGKYISKTCIIYPYYKNNQIVNLKYRDNLKNFGAVSGGELVFYGIDDIQYDDWCIIVEGENDKLAWSEVGVNNCMSVPNGAQISKEEREKILKGESFESHMNLEYLDNCYDDLSHIKLFILATDDDPAGIKLRNELARRLGKNRCKYVLFNGKKDSNELLVSDGHGGLLSILDNKIDFPIDNIIFAKDIWNELEYEYIHGKEKGKSTGWKSLDPHFTLRFGDFIVGNGYAGNGKSTFVFNLMMNTAIMYDWKWGGYFPENYPVKRVYDSLAEILIGNTTDKDAKTRADFYDYKMIVNEFLQKHIFLVASNSRYTPKELNTKASEMISRLGIVGFIKDPWNSLKHKLTNRTLDEYLEDALSEEVEFAIRHNIINIVNAHPPTPLRDKEKNYPAPSMHEIRGGSIWPNKAYVEFCIHKDLASDPLAPLAELHVQKCKDHKLIGIPTQRDNPIILGLQRKSNRFRELDLSDGGKWTSPIDNFIENIKTQLNFKNE